VTIRLLRRMVLTVAAQRRHVLIQMARKRQRPGTGSQVEFLRMRTASMQFPDLRITLSGIPWAVTGAAAARLYMPERMTNDLDILIHKRNSSIVHLRLKQSKAVNRGRLTIGGTSWALATGYPLDVIESREEWVDVALADASHNLDPQGLPILPLSYQVLMKFQASRVQDLADITRMLGQATEDQLESTRQLFKKWLHKELDDLESLISLGQLELSDS